MSQIDEEEIVRRLEEISRFAARQETVVRDLERARQTVRKQASVSQAKRFPFLRRLTRSGMLRIAAVLGVGIAGLVALRSSRIEVDGATAAMARMVQAMDKMLVMHEVYRTNYGGPQTHATETWYDFGSRTVLARFVRDGQCFKIHSLNYDTMEEVVYEPPTPVVRIVYHCDYDPHGYPDSSAQVVQERLDLYGRRDAKVTHERSQYKGTDVDVYTFEIAKNEHRRRERATLVVDRRTDLPLARTWKMWTPQGEVVFDQTGTFDFPATGPKDIYELGAPRSAQVVLDVASKERYEKKLRLEQRILQLEEEFKRGIQEIYRLSDGQVLALIPPSLARPRLELEQAHEEVRRLVAEQVRERDALLRQRGDGKGREIESRRDSSDDGQSPPHFQYFTWDDGIDMQKGRPVFVGPASIKGALGRIVRLSVFEYEIPAELADVNIPGDWIVRKNSSWEERLAAFEAIVQDYTGRAIRFQPHQVQREVIVARGRFHFQPPSGTYNDSWIHVYADRLDPDERSGGGGGSLEKFVRYLGEVNFNQQVIDETEGDRDIEIHYGWHESGYIRKITDENERAVKLQMVLDNVSRQTGLSFSIEQREVIVWRVVEENPPE